MRFLRYILITLLLLAVAFLGVGWYLSQKYSDKIQKIVLQELNNSLNAEVSVEAIDFSSFRKIPYLSLSFSGVLIKESKDFTHNPDTLLYAGNLSFQFDLWDVYNGKYELRHLDVESAKCYMKQSKTGTPNYTIWKPSKDTASVDISFQLDAVNLTNINYTYKDSRNNILVRCEVNKLKVHGDFSSEQLELKFNGNTTNSTVLVAGVYALKGQSVQVNSGIIYHNNESTFELQNGEVIIDQTVDLNLGGFVAPKSYQFFAKTDKANLKQVLDLLPDSWDRYWIDYAPSGIAKIKFNIAGNSIETPKIDIGFELSNGRLITKGNKKIELKALNLSGSYSNGKRRNARSSSVDLTELSGQFPSGSFKGSAMISNFKDLRIKGNVEGSLALDELTQFLKLEKIDTCKGDIVFNLAGDIYWDKILEESVVISKSKLEGTIDFTDVGMKLKSSVSTLKNYQGKVKFDKQQVHFEKSEGQLNSTNFILNGSADNFFQWVLEEYELLRIVAEVEADKLILEEFLSVSASSEKGTIRLLAIPGIELQLSAKIGRLSYENFKAQNVETKLFVGQKILKANPIKMDAMNGTARGKLALIRYPKEGYNMSFIGDFESVDIKELFTQFKNFGQDEIKAENIAGTTNLNLNLEGKLNDNFEILPASIFANVHLDISNGKLTNYNTLQSISDYFKTNMVLKKVFHADDLSERLKDVSFDRLENEFFVRNSALFIPKVQLKSSVLNVNVSGKHSFNDSIDYKVDFDISDLLIKDRNFETENGEVVDDGTGRYRVFMLVKGTTGNLEIEIDKSAKKSFKKHQRNKEGKEFKQALHKEFGWFEKDTTMKKESHKTKYEIEWEEADNDTTTFSSAKLDPKNSKTKKKRKWLQPNEEEKEFFDFKDDDF